MKRLIIQRIGVYFSIQLNQVLPVHFIFDDQKFRI